MTMSYRTDVVNATTRLILSLRSVMLCKLKADADVATVQWFLTNEA